MAGGLLREHLTRWAVAGGVVGISSLTGCAPPAPPFDTTHAAAIVDSVAAATADLRRHSDASDWDAMVGMYSADPSFRIYEDGRLQYRSPADIAERLGGLPPGTSMRTEYRETEIQALGPGLALTHSLFETTFDMGDGQSFSFGGAVTSVWVHEADGWKIRAGHSSSPLPGGS